MEKDKAEYLDELILNMLGSMRETLISRLEVGDELAHRVSSELGGNLLGYVNEMAWREWLWVDATFLGEAEGDLLDVVGTSPGECASEDLTVEAVVSAYRSQAQKTDALLRTTPLSTLCKSDMTDWGLRDVADRLISFTIGAGERTQRLAAALVREYGEEFSPAAKTYPFGGAFL